MCYTDRQFERNAELAPEHLAMLNKRGYLEAIYMAIASMSHLADLVDRKNRLRRLQAADG